MWQDTSFTRKLGLRYPIVQGPFGGGNSSVDLAGAVSEAGGLGSFGLQGMEPAAIAATIAALKTRTRAPFSVNLWVSTEDAGAGSVSAAQRAAALEPFLPLYRELGLTPPQPSTAPRPRFEDQAEAVLAAQPPALSFVFGVPPAGVLARCRELGIRTLGTATTVDEGLALERAGVDVVVASGFEAGGHRGSFLRTAESSLTGTFALVPQMADALRIPVVAAGGIADGRGIAAALTLGASGVQIGTAFLACEESNAWAGHRAALRAGPRRTLLTRAFSGRLARGLANRLVEHVAERAAPALPYPIQAELSAGLRAEAQRRGEVELVALWAGQAAPLVRHRKAAELLASLVAETEDLLGPRNRER
jgi:nitronate monooxygenase